MEDAQYASIGEVKKLTREAAAALAGEESLPAPPLPASNRPRAQSSRAQLQTGTTIKAASEENMCSRPSSESLERQLTTSNSYPSLSSLVGQPEDRVDGKKLPPIYAKLHKVKMSTSSPSSPPPPLPPPIAPGDIPKQTGADLGLPPPLPPPLTPGTGGNEVPKQNGIEDEEQKGLVLVPRSENERPRRPIPLPRTHVYEVVPDDMRLQQEQLLPSSMSNMNSLPRKHSKKKKNSGAGKGKDRPEGKITSPLIALSELEPLPSNGKSMKLLEFVKKFSNYLPIRANVEEGYCGTEERFVISSGDVYNFHFVKNEKIVSIHDSGGSCFSIPLNSAIGFGLLYNPSNNFKTALQGYVFKTVSELASSKHAPPRILCATRAHVTTDQRSSVQAQELLLVRKIGRTTVMRRPVLKAYSLTSNEDKTLQDDCEGHFSTCPELVKLYLPEILEHFGNSLPLETMLYMQSDTIDDLPLHLTSDVVTLTHTAVESSIIASTCWEYERQDELSEEDRALVAIPIDLDIEVTFLGRESDDEQLYESTRSYFEKFNSLTIRDMKSSGGMQRGASLTLAQKKLYKAVREGFESKGTEIKMPYRISGIFDGEARSLDDKLHVYQMLEGASPPPNKCTPLSPAHSRGADTGNHLESNQLSSPHPDPATSPNHTPSSSDPSTSDPSTHGHPPPSHQPPAPPENDLLTNDDLGAVYSAIDDIIDSKKSAKMARKSPDSHSQRSDSSSGSSLAGKAADPPSISTPQPPKPLPRNRSQTELKSHAEPTPSAAGGQSSREVKGYSDYGDKSVVVEELCKNYSKLQLEVQALKRELQSARENEALYEVVPPSTQQPSLVLRPRALTRTQQPRPLSIVKASSTEDQQKNREELRNLDHMEIISLLECMNLSQYKEQFMQEQVDGEILAECDEVMLEKELNINSAIHRTRLLKVIRGRHSAMSFLSGTDLYSTLDHSYN